jgi:HIV Tat-specific factor 1
MTVKFRDPLSAQACVLVRSSPVMLIIAELVRTQRMNGRYFAGRRVEASLYYGRQRFKRSGAEEPETNGQEAEKRRLDDFAKWLMSEED